MKTTKKRISRGLRDSLEVPHMEHRVILQRHDVFQREAPQSHLGPVSVDDLRPRRALGAEERASVTRPAFVGWTQGRAPQAENKTGIIRKNPSSDLNF